MYLQEVGTKYWVGCCNKSSLKYHRSAVNVYITLIATCSPNTNIKYNLMFVKVVILVFNNKECPTHKCFNYGNSEKMGEFS